MTNVTMTGDPRKILAHVEKQTGAWLGELCDTASELAKRPPPQGSPYLTGNNRDSIGFDHDNPLSWRIFTRSSYGAWLELGTSRMAARPYMAPAIQEAAREMERKGVD